MQAPSPYIASGQTQSPIVQACEDVNRALENLTEVVRRLGVKIDPIMTPVSEGTAGDVELSRSGTGRPFASVATLTLQGFAQQIKDAARTLEGYEQRVEL